jgi:hypothetical protein
MKKKLLLLGSLLVSSWLLVGCSTTITNLTPSTQKRTPNGLYPFEVALDTRDRCVRQETLKPYVQVGGQLYPMQPTLGLSNRWETFVPVSADKEYVNYRYKFNYESRGIPKAQPSSRLSSPFQLQIQEK